MDNKNKYLSRKFILAVAAFLSSIGAGITGLATDNEKLAIAGAVCSVLASAIYAACEAYIDAKK